MKKLSLIMILVAYILIVFGGYVASSQSGMGCGPEWPLCNGAVIPSLQGKTLVEFTHRVIGVILGVLALLLFFKVLGSSLGRPVRIAAYWMVGLLVVQVLLGALVVWWDLPTFVIAIHLIIAMAFLYSVIWIWYASNQDILNIRKKSKTQRSLIVHLNIVIALLILTIGLGAYIKHDYYGLACGWLTCGGSFLPNTVGQWLQTLHRVLAVVCTVYILILAGWTTATNLHYGLSSRLRWAAFIVLIQAGIGVITVLSYIHISWAVVHLAIGTVLLAVSFESRIYLELHYNGYIQERSSIEEGVSKA